VRTQLVDGLFADLLQDVRCLSSAREGVKLVKHVIVSLVNSLRMTNFIAVGKTITQYCTGVGI
jgi:hypothetical protein